MSQWPPRREYRDYDYEVDEKVVRTVKHYPAENSSMFQGELATVRAYHDSFFKEGVLDEARIERGAASIREHPNAEFANITMITLINMSPYYTDRAGPRATANFVLLQKRRAELWKRAGFHVVALIDHGPEDNGDRVHLNTSGGYKLARAAAGEVKKIFETAK